MKILCMEDQIEKYMQIEAVIGEIDAEITWKKNCQFGLMELRNKKYDVVLLDMSMPICDDMNVKENFDSYAGMAVLREIKRKNYDLKVIVITGFSDFEKGFKLITLSELDSEIQKKYGNVYMGYVKYDSTSVEWQERLKEKLKTVNL